MTPSEAANPRALARVGSILKGKYTIDRLIGMGGMASVYAATHRNGNRVAIKLLHPELSLDTDVLKRFLREGYVANRIEHPGAVLVLDDDVTEDGAAFLVMELLLGESFEQLWQRSNERLAPAQLSLLALGALDVLAAAHERGVVHRDIKPENLFITREGRVKVLDFGIARLRDGGALATATRTGSMMGTPAFMPPEQARGRRDEIDARADVWAMGATMFTLLSGRFVHPAETMEEMLVFAATEEAPPLATVAPGVPREVAAVVDRALAFKKEKRWEHGASMHRALAEAHKLAFGTPAPERYVSAEVDTHPSAPSASALLAASNASLSSAPTQASKPALARDGVSSTTAGVTQPPTLTSARRGRMTGMIAAALVVTGGGALLLTLALRTPTHAVDDDVIKASSATPSSPGAEPAPPPSTSAPSSSPLPSPSETSSPLASPSASTTASPVPARPARPGKPAVPTKKKVDPYAP